MKQQLSLIIVLVLLPIMMFAAAPVVSNVQVSQRTDGSMLVDITYDVADDDGDDVEITVECSNDGGATWDYAITQLTGDVGIGITPGAGKSIVWNGAAEHPDDYDTDYIIRITAEDGMILVPAGSFQMGDTHGGYGSMAHPAHTVNLSSFYIGKYEVTHQEVIDVFNWAYQQGYISCTSNTLTNTQGDPETLFYLDDSDCAIDWNGSQLVFGANPEAPSIQCSCIEVTWFGAVAFCNFLSEIEGLTQCYDLSVWSCNWEANGYRLPTEAEWEYSARGATNSPDYYYSGSDNIGDVCWYNSNSDNYTHLPGELNPNGIGTHDQSGNVYEWCWDRLDYYESDEQTNPTGPESGLYHVIRGGGWGSETINCEIFNRNGTYPHYTAEFYGFRLARTAPGGEYNNAPEQPFNPIPADDAVGIGLTPTLRWSCSDANGDDLHYNVYLGTSEELTETDIVATTISDTFFATSELEEDTTYYWKIVASDGSLINVSPVWSYTTTPYPGFVLAPAGCFEMGGSGVAEPVHTVILDAFFIGKYEVTHQEVIDVFNWAYQQGYINCTTSTVTNASGNQQELLDLDDSYCAINWNGSELVFGGSSYASDVQCPCIEITWYGSVAYCNYLSLQQGLAPCYDLSDWSCDWSANGYRLPTEAEWEYSARGATNTPDYLYAGSDTIGDVAWYRDNSDTGSGRQTHPVGQKDENDIGTYDQSGNVWEWCWDWYSPYTSGAQTNPHGPDSGSGRVVRGGYWGVSAGGCEVAYRSNGAPSNSSRGIGFRLCRTAE